MPLETAMKLASASSTCEKHKCPYMAQCKGDYSTCAMKEIALIIRSQNAEIDSLTAMVKAYQAIVDATHTYICDLEKINKRYHDLVIAFEHGYRPKKVKRLKRVPKPKKDPVEMDGKEKYAYSPPPSSEPDPPLVVI